MRKIERLKKEALESCTFREHRMDTFVASDKKSAFSHCLECGAWLAVHSAPVANDIEIGGSAVAIYCDKKEKNT